MLFFGHCNCRLNYDDKFMFILCPFGYVFALVNSSGRLLVFVYISSSFRGFSLYSIIPNVGDYYIISILYSALICVACDNVVSHNFPVGQREAKTAKTHINTVWHLNPVMIALPVLLPAIG